MCSRLTPEQIAALRQGYWVGPDPLGRQPGVPLWPDKFDAEALGTIHAVMGAYEWEALYQQRPQKLEGNLIRGYDIKRIGPEYIPLQSINWVRYWDLAVSGKEDADMLAGAKVAQHEGALYIRHIAHFPGPWADARPRIVATMLRDGSAVRQGIEVAGQQAGYYQEFKRDPQLMALAIEAVRPRDVGSKEVRAQVWASRIQDGLVFVVDDGTWGVDNFVSECIQFPQGRRDDMVDAVSGAVQMLSSGAGWAAWAAEQMERAKRERADPLILGAAARELEEAVATDWVMARRRLIARAQECAERGSMLVSADFPQALSSSDVGAILGDVAAMYLNQKQDIKAQIILNERRRLGV